MEPLYRREGGAVKRGKAATNSDTIPYCDNWGKNALEKKKDVGWGKRHAQGRCAKGGVWLVISRPAQGWLERKKERIMRGDHV